MISMMFFASMNLAVKLLNSLDTPVPTLELILVRMGGTLVCSVVYTVYTRVPDPILGPRSLRVLLTARGMFGLLFLFPNYWALKYLSLSDDTSLSFLSPLVTAVFARLFLKEAYSKKQACAALCSLFGVILVARPPFLFDRLGAGRIHASSNLIDGDIPSAQRFIAVGAALLSVLGGSMAQISMRAIGKRAHPMHMMNYFSLWCVLTAGPGMALFEIEPVFPRQWQSICMLVMMSVFGFLAQILLTMGLQRETAARGSMGVYVQVIFAAVFELIFFGTVPSPLTVAGGVIIIACAVCVVLSKQPQKEVATVREPVVEEGSVPRQQSDESQRLLGV
ncbi:integral membrane protein DUF6 [Coniophora puteana RWD-64-598 SS2]|uniref:Integral membrane protein DUF6 n=1 Tax=Coniophora puteana (strain RWD-64-598) TaxID=741705 RepID=A0A5M3MF75_CONPW|nr:integral membrane protein DUF6 [Coniophora puteana RWD-64-598 SS2]EIW77919.1 integral membrane protein DUF6 [Coniophora puteana RWD-64-598 SS2]